jgi:hypothetical protein
MQNYYINPVEDGWILVSEGDDTELKRARTKPQLIRATAEYMKGKTGSVKVRKRNGEFGEERTYPRASDPRKSKG